MKVKQKLDVDTVIFDFDNTLVDTRKAIQEAYNEIFSEINQKYGASPERLMIEIRNIEEEVKSNSGNLDRKHFDRTRYFEVLSERLKLNISSQDIKKYADSFYNMIIKKSEPFPNVESVLPALKARGKRLGLVSEGSESRPGYKSRHISHFSFSKYFDFIVVAGETIPEHKTSPLIFAKIIQQYNLNPSRTVVIGDRMDMDIENAMENGMHAILFVGRADPRRGKHKPDFKIDDLNELLDII
jgi:HAD superfamily hydrolase (TIGR01549 family)